MVEFFGYSAAGLSVPRIGNYAIPDENLPVGGFCGSLGSLLDSAGTVIALAMIAVAQVERFTVMMASHSRQNCAAGGYGLSLQKFQRRL